MGHDAKLRRVCLLWVVWVAILASCSDDDPLVMPPKPKHQTFVVRPNGSGSTPDIRSAIMRCADGDTIALANGRFRGPGNRDLDTEGKKVVIRSLSGDPIYCVIDCDGTALSPHRGFSFHSRETPMTLVDGVTIEDGNSNDAGSAIRCSDGCAPTFRNVIFSSNYSRAVAVLGGTPHFENCTFLQNLNGALSCVDGAAVTLASSSFRYNYADGAGAALVVSSSTVEMTDCLLLGNNSTYSGGAVFCSGTVDGPQARLIMRNCALANNQAVYNGGAIHMDRAELLMTKCMVMGNVAGLDGGGICFYDASSGSVDGSTFVKNQAQDGSAVSCGFLSFPSISRSIFSLNLVGIPVYCDISSGSAVPTIQCSDIFANAAGDWVGCIATQLSADNNLSADPLFCDINTMDLRIRPDSPCATSECGLIGALEACGLLISRIDSR